MIKQPIRVLAHRIARIIRGLRGGVLTRPLCGIGDQAIDAALARLKLSRADLFTPSRAFPRHRVRMAYMLATLGIDPARASVDHWEELKAADSRCAYCPNLRRCQRWLEWGRRNDAPRIFCPNATLFAAIAAEQETATRRADHHN